MITFYFWEPLVLLPLPFFIHFLLPKAASQESSGLRVPFFNNVNELNAIAKKRSTKRRWFSRLAYVIWFLLVFASCNPHYVGKPIKLPSEGRDLMLAVDTSGSMETPDLSIGGKQVDRLTAVKSVLAEFIERRPSDRLGLILFGDNAYVQTPLTYDHTTVSTLLQESRINIAGPRTAIGDAIGLALKRLKDRPTDSKVLILLTDGANTAGEIGPIQAAKLAASKGLRVYTVGVGADQFVQPGLFGSRIGQRTINPSLDLDEETLQQIASITKGQYFRAKNTEELAKIYRLLDKLEPTSGKASTYRPRKALFTWPLGCALMLSVVMALSKLLPGLQAQLARKAHGSKSANRAIP